MQSELDRLAVKVRDHHGTQVAISGCARGADTWWARSALRAGLRLWAYVPFLAQPSKWPPDDRKTRDGVLSVADRTLVSAADWDVWLLHARNGGHEQRHLGASPRAASRGEDATGEPEHPLRTEQASCTATFVHMACAVCADR